MAGKAIVPPSRALAGLTVTAVAAMSASAWAAVPTHHTFQPAGLGVSFSLPSDWGEDLPADPGWQWQAIAPGFVAHLYVAAAPTTSSSEAFGAGLVKQLRERLTRVVDHASVVSTPARVASVAAVRIVVRYRGVGTTGPAEVVLHIYSFVHARTAYVFEYATTATWIARKKPAFDQSIRSVHFPMVA